MDQAILAHAQDAADRYGVPFDLVQRVISKESGGRHYTDDGNVLTSSAGARGVMQLMPGTARGLGVNPDDPIQNVEGGVRYLAQQYHDFGQDPTLAMAAYNAGPGAVRKYGGVPPYRQTQEYVGEHTPSAGELFGHSQPQSAQASPAGDEALPSVSDLFAPATTPAAAPPQRAALAPGAKRVPTLTVDGPVQTYMPDDGVPKAAPRIGVGDASSGQTVLNPVSGQQEVYRTKRAVPILPDGTYAAPPGTQKGPDGNFWPVNAPVAGIPQKAADLGGGKLSPAAQAELVRIDERQRRLLDSNPAVANSTGAVHGFFLGGMPAFGGALNAMGQGVANATGQHIEGQSGPVSMGDAYDAMKVAEQNRLHRMEQQHPVATYGGEVGGAFLNPVAAAGGEFAAAGKTGAGVLGRSALLGGAMGATSGVGASAPGDEAGGAARGVVPGAVMGAAVPWLANKAAEAGGAVARPAVNAVSRATGGRVPQMAEPTYIPQNARQTLAGRGIPLTPGQAFGGPVQAAERTMAKVPLIGDVIKGAQARSFNDWNKAVATEVLSPLGEKLPSGVNAGRPAVQYLEKRIGDEYDNILGRVKSVTVDPQFGSNLGALVNDAKNGGGLSTDDAARLEKVVDNQVLSRFVNGDMDAQTWKTVDSNLGKMAAKGGEFGDAVGAVQREMRDLLGRSNPTEADAINKANESWANFKRFQHAAAMRNPDEPGVFTPSQLASAVKTLGGTANTARGSAAMQDAAENGMKVLGNQIPESHGVLPWLIGAAMGGHSMHVPVPVMAGGAAALLPYTPAGQRVVTALAPKGINPAAVQTMAQAARAIPGLVPMLTQRGLPQTPRAQP